MISRTEKSWLDELYTHAKQQFSGTFLPSHDHTHHLRVWNICKALLRSDTMSKEGSDASLVEGTLIAAFFHDLGMVRSTGEEHGALGREHCEDYFRERNRPLPERYPEILDAIELHDRKTGDSRAGHPPVRWRDIPGILSLADDLEAMGIIGVYRYTEIYLKRDRDLQTLGNRILKNAFERFQSITEGGSHYTGVLESYRNQYLYLLSFFDQYNQQLMVERQPDAVIHGHLGVVNLIRDFSLNGAIAPGRFHENAKAMDTGNYVLEFFTKLAYELEKARL